MKKRIMLVVSILTLTVSSAKAQTNNEETVFKPVAGQKTFELFVNPLSATPISFNNVRLRKFITENKAYRLGVNLGLTSESPNFNFNLALMPGIEKHFNGTKRLSPYIGGEFLFLGSFSSSSLKDVAKKTTTSTSGSFADGTNRSNLTVGLNALIGTDFYVSKNLYLGIEAGYGLYVISTLGNTTTLAVDGGTTTSSTADGSTALRLGTNLGTNVNGAIRFGFVF